RRGAGAVTAVAPLRRQLVELPPADPGWLRLVEEAPEATVFHLPAWSRVLADTYRYPTAALAELDEGGRVVAGLPLARVRRLRGVPVQPRRFFAALLRHVLGPGLATVALAEGAGGRPVAAAVVLAWNQTAIGKFQASDAESWELRPNHLVSWEALRWARER